MYFSKAQIKIIMINAKKNLRFEILKYILCIANFFKTHILFQYGEEFLIPK